VFFHESNGTLVNIGLGTDDKCVIDQAHTIVLRNSPSITNGHGWGQTAKCVIDKAHTIVLRNSPSITNAKTCRDVVDQTLHDCVSQLPFKHVFPKEFVVFIG
jgi:hypothetical protein